jgi:hypothetical protein
MLGFFALLVLVAALFSFGGSAGPADRRDGSDQASEAGLFPVHECGGGYWPGPWTTCPEADWVAGVVKAGGYRIVGETGSALIAAGRTTSFYVWASDGGAVPAQRREIARGLYHVLGRVEGVTVTGNDVRVSWSAQGFVFWVEAGPDGDSVLPDLDGLRPLVAASRRVAPPR